MQNSLQATSKTAAILQTSFTLISLDGSLQQLFYEFLSETLKNSSVSAHKQNFKNLANNFFCIYMRVRYAKFQLSILKTVGGI